MRFLRATLTVLCLAVASPSGAHPQSDYERESVQIALDEVGGELDPSPEGKVIEDVQVVTLDVIEPRDPAPRFLNWFHITSRAYVVEREVLLGRGDRYDEALVEESERNLRVRQLSVVLIMPVKGSRPDRVRLLVVTKDVWSLRVNWEPVFVNGRLQSLYLQPSEENLFGRHKILNANVFLERLTYTAGLGFVDSRIGGSRLRMAVNANVTWNCRTNDVEGSSGSFSYGKPLYSTRTRWGWVASAQWDQGMVRPAGAVGQSICNGDSAVPVDLRATPRVESLPYEFHRDALGGTLAATRSFGVRFKENVSFGLETDRRVYQLPSLTGQPAIVKDEFAKLLPVSDTRISPFAQLHAYENRYLRVLDFETLGLQEDFTLGHDVWLRAYPAAKAVGSSRDLLGIHSGVGYTVPVLDGLVRAYASTNFELSDMDHSDAEVAAGARAVTPRTPIGRLFVDGYVLDRVKNYLNPLTSLGGTGRLRGYRTSAFVGPDVVVTNVEFRSRPVEILAVQVGVAAFYDVGDASRDFASMKLRQGAGFGLRFLFPQLDRDVFRIDVGFPLDPHDKAAETSIVAQFRQAFGMPTAASPATVP